MQLMLSLSLKTFFLFSLLHLTKRSSKAQLSGDNDRGCNYCNLVLKLSILVVLPSLSVTPAEPRQDREGKRSGQG